MLSILFRLISRFIPVDLISARLYWAVCSMSTSFLLMSTFFFLVVHPLLLVVEGLSDQRSTRLPTHARLQEEDEETGDPAGFHLIPLPFADDIRGAPVEEGKRGSSPRVTPHFGEAQVEERAAPERLTEAARAWIKKLTLKHGGYPPDSYPNPGTFVSAPLCCRELIDGTQRSRTIMRNLKPSHFRKSLTRARSRILRSRSMMGCERCARSWIYFHT